jgi:hypothetical protein
LRFNALTTRIYSNSDQDLQQLRPRFTTTPTKIYNNSDQDLQQPRPRFAATPARICSNPGPEGPTERQKRRKRRHATFKHQGGYQNVSVKLP